jgi:hypothetical protein
MTRSQLLSGVAVLLLGVACGRLGAPVRAPASTPAPPQSEAPPGEVQLPASPVDEEAEEKQK